MPLRWGPQRCQLLVLVKLCFLFVLCDSCGDTAYPLSSNTNTSWIPTEYLVGQEIDVQIPTQVTNRYELELMGKIIDSNSTSMTISNCSGGLYFCTTDSQMFAVEKSIVFTGLKLSICGLFNESDDSAKWGLSITTDNGNDTTTDYYQLSISTGFPVGILPNNGDLSVKSGQLIVPPIAASVCDAWGNRNFTVSDVVVELSCDYQGVDANFKLYGTLSQSTKNGSVSFPDIIASGRKGSCKTRLQSSSLVYLPGLSESSEVRIIILEGDPHRIHFKLVDTTQVTILQTNAITLASTAAMTDFNVFVRDSGDNTLDFTICTEIDLVTGKSKVIHQRSGKLNCILLDITWIANPDMTIAGISAIPPTTAMLEQGMNYMVNSSNIELIGRSNKTAYRLQTSEITGTIALTGRLYTAQGVLSGEYHLTVIDKGEFQCLLPKTGDSLLTEDIAGEVLDATTMDEIERTFFDLAVPPAPFVRFNVSSRNWRDHHLLIPPSYQYWVLMQSPFFIEVDPVLSTYFCFGFNYARVSDLAISLRKPFCGSSQLLKVVSELAILFFDLGDSSAQFHKTRGSFSGTEGTAKFGNYSGFIPRIEKLAICVGDRILSPATTGYHIQCCKRDTGECSDGSRGHSLQTAVIVIATILTTLAAIGHWFWVAKSLKGCFRICIRFADIPAAERAKVVIVHVLCVLFPAFSVIVNRDYVTHLHPLTILWSFELIIMGVFLLVCVVRIFSQHPKLKVLYDFSLAAVGFISLWLLWASWTWTVPALFLQTRRTLVPFTCFSTLLAHCTVKPGVISQFHKHNIGALSLATDGHDMILDSLIGTMLFAGFLTGLVYSLNSFEVVTDTQVILAVLVVLGVGLFMSWSFSARFSAALRRTILDSRWFAEKAAMVVNMQRDAVEQAADFIEEETRPARKQSSNAFAQIMSVFTGGNDEEEEYTEEELRTPFIRRDSSATDESLDSQNRPPTYSPPFVQQDADGRPDSPPVTLPPTGHVSFNTSKSKRKGILKFNTKSKKGGMTRKSSVLVIKDALSNVMNEVMSPSPSALQSPTLSPSSRRKMKDDKSEVNSNRSSRTQSPLTLASLLASRSRGSGGKKTPRSRSPQLSVTSQDTAPSYRWTSLPTSPVERPDNSPARQPSLLLPNQNLLSRESDVSPQDSSELLAPPVRSRLSGMRTLLGDEKQPDKDDRFKENDDSDEIGLISSGLFKEFANMAEMVDDDEYQHLINHQQQQMNLNGSLLQFDSFRKTASIDTELFPSGLIGSDGTPITTPSVNTLQLPVEIWSRIGIPPSPNSLDDSPLNDLLQGIPRVESISAVKRRQTSPTPPSNQLTQVPRIGSAAMPPISPLRSPMQFGVDVPQRRASEGKSQPYLRSSSSLDNMISPVQSPKHRSTDTSPELSPQHKTERSEEQYSNGAGTPNYVALPRRSSGIPVGQLSPKSPRTEMLHSPSRRGSASSKSPKNGYGQAPPSPARGSSNPLIAGALEEADKLLAAIQLAPSQPQPSSDGGWIEGGTWDGGKWHSTKKSSSTTNTPIGRSLSNIGTQFSARLKARVAEHSTDDHHTADLKRNYKSLVKRAVESKRTNSPTNRQHSPTSRDSPREYIVRAPSEGGASSLTREPTVPQSCLYMEWKRDAAM